MKTDVGIKLRNNTGRTSHQRWSTATTQVCWSNIRRNGGGLLDYNFEKREGKLDECVSVRLFHVRNHKNSLIELGIEPLSEKLSEKCNKFTGSPRRSYTIRPANVYESRNVLKSSNRYTRYVRKVMRLIR